jgi:hypothetical protein
MSEVEKWAIKALLAKIESAYGDDAEPTGAANAVEGYDVAFRRLVTPLPRNYAAPTIGAKGSVEALVHAQISFWTPIAGAGAAGAVPAYGPLLRAAALDQTVVGDPATHVEYALVDAEEESVSLYFHRASKLRKLLGCRGTLGIDVMHGREPRWRHDFLGLYLDGVESAELPTLDMSAWKPWVATSAVETPTFAFAGESLKLHSLTINLNIDRTFRDGANHNEVVVTGRDNGVRGELVVMAEALADFDPEALARDQTKSALQLVHGAAAGAIVQIDAPKVQVLEPQEENVEGQLAWRMGLLFCEDAAGNDEVKITVK